MRRLTLKRSTTACRVLVDRSSGVEIKTWPVKYSTMFHMTNDSHLFCTRNELEENEGAWPVGGNRYHKKTKNWVPLYEGKMVQAFDHRAANIVVNPQNQHRPAQPQPATLTQHQDPNWLPDPQYWVLESECNWSSEPKLGSRIQGDYCTHKRQNLYRCALCLLSDSATKCPF